MNDRVVPNLKYWEYLPREVIRVVNSKQQKLYIKHGVFPVDLYTVKDERSEGDLLVMIFMKKQTEKLYEAWMNHELS